MTKLLAFILSLLLVSCELNNQNSEKDKQRIDKVCDQFMQSFVESKSYEAMQLLKRNSIIPPDSIDSLQITISEQYKRIFPSFGKIISYQFITERNIKDFIAKRYYILKFEKYYIKFDFTLYKTVLGWAITNFNYNQDLSEILY